MKQVSLARRAARLSPTMPASSHDHAIPFDSGHGFPALFPDLTAAAEKALTTYRHETLQYGVRPGLPDLRDAAGGVIPLPSGRCCSGTPRSTGRVASQGLHAQPFLKEKRSEQ